MYFLSAYKRGIFNKYRKNMPLFEMITKDLIHLIHLFLNFFKNGLKNKYILCYPHYPSRGSTIYKIARSLNLNITNKLNHNFDYAIYWEYATIREEFDVLENINSSIPVVNLYSRDISKVFVDQVMEKAFGYCTAIDPLSYNGEYVRKNDANAQHDGKVLYSPIDKKEEGYIYQILIDNRIGEDSVLDYRVPIIGGLTEYVYHKERSIKSRFKNKPHYSINLPIEEIFSKEEMNCLEKFIEEMKIDFGEADVLRDNNTKKIYVVDVNNTAQGPPAGINKKEGEKSMKYLAQKFKEKFVF